MASKSPRVRQGTEPSKFLFFAVLTLIVVATIIYFHQATPLVSDATASNSTEFCLYGCPANNSNTDRIIKHHILELSNNPTTKFADWVAYRLSRDTFGSHCKRTWMQDPDLPSDETLSPHDYDGIRAALSSDRGHQAPLASLCGSPYRQEADYLSNITPQKSALNEGAWEHLERAERGVVYSGYADQVYSITGPLFERDAGQLPQARLDHTIPSGYWKIISVLKSGKLEAVGFVMDQDLPKEAYYCQSAKPISEIEARAHLQFFTGLALSASNDMRSQPAANLLTALHC